MYINLDGHFGSSQHRNKLVKLELLRRVMSQLALATNSIATLTEELGETWTWHKLAGLAVAHIALGALCWATHKACTAARQPSTAPLLRQPLYEGFAIRD
jgi:hypothetical protein